MSGSAEHLTDRGRGLIPRPRQREKTRRRVVSSRPVRLKMSEVYSTPVHDSPEPQEVSSSLFLRVYDFSAVVYHSACVLDVYDRDGRA